MEEKKTRNKSLMAVSLLLLSVVAVLILLFLMRPSDDRDGIVLPDPMAESSQEKPSEVQSSGSFLTIDQENVVTVLDSLEKPEYYHQTYEVQLSSGRSSSTRTVELWVNGSWIHAEVRDGQTVKSVFTDGQEAWLWYDRDLTPVPFSLSEDLLLEDLIGLPQFDYQRQIEAAVRTEAGYAVREEDLLQYVYVSTENSDESASSYWFSLDSGLLYSCSTTESQVQVYDVRQTAFERLAYADQAFEGRFCLPDGTVPFTAETRMLLP